jgi:hypothetical protein
METGYYNNKPIDWESFKVSLFIPHLFFDDFCNGCGANTLALLTGIPPRKIHNTNQKNPSDWKDAFMVSFLKRKGFKIIPLTKCDVTAETFGFTSNNIGDRHVLMLSQLLGKNVASWSVVHNQLWYHNFQTCSFSSLNLVNNPSLTCYLLCHPKWKINVKKPKSKLTY